MKARAHFFITIGLPTIILGTFLFVLSTQKQEPPQIFPATINRDCAPWDGSAFTMSIPLNDGTVIDISIWQAPDINFPVTFSFPDHTGQVGNALLIHEVDLPEPLNGKAFFWRVNQDGLVEGRFDFVTEAGRGFKGQFKAEWGDEIVYCG